MTRGRCGSLIHYYRMTFSFTTPRRFNRRTRRAYMKKFLAFSVLAVASVCLLWIPRARTAASDVAEILQLLNCSAKAVAARDLNGLMSIYAPGHARYAN